MNQLRPRVDRATWSPGFRITLLSTRLKALSTLEGIARLWNPYEYATNFVNTFTHFEPSARGRTNPERDSWAKDTRQVPIDQLEDYLKETGNRDFPFEDENIPHYDLTNNMPDLKATKRRARAKAANARVRQMVAAKSKPKVTLAAPSYPTIKQSLERSSFLVSAPTARTRVQRSGAPRIQYRPNGDCSIRHRELVADIKGSILFSTLQLSINPGLNRTFPWLSRIANNYESYLLNGLNFCFETASPTTYSGQVMLAVDYDPSDSAPTTKIQASSYRGTVTASPWCPSCHSSLRSDLQKRKTYFMRAGSIPPNEDICLYDVGNLFVCTYGQAADEAIVGELWIEYDIRLFTPKTLSSGGGNSIWGQYSATSNSTLAYDNGNLPATTTFVGNSPIFATWTFTQDWQGVVSWQVSGSGITTPSTAFGTATLGSPHFTTNTASSSGYQTINALAGQTYNTQIGNTAISFLEIYFTQGTGAFN